MSGVPVTGSSAISRSPKRPMIPARLAPPRVRRARARPSISGTCSTCELPAKSRMSTGSAERTMDTRGTVSATSRAVKVMLVFSKSSPVTTMSAARSARSVRYVSTLSRLPTTTRTLASCRSIAVFTSGSITQYGWPWYASRWVSEMALGS